MRFFSFVFNLKRVALFAAILATGLFCQPAMASSGIGHYGQSIYLMAIEMPRAPLLYKAVLGDELFTALTDGISTGRQQFDFQNLNKAQLAFLAGCVGPDACDLKYHLGIGSPIHEKYPQRALNIVNDLSSNDSDKLTARAFFFGWAFHYIGDLVVHPGLNKENQMREGRDFAKRPFAQLFRHRNN